MGEVSEMIISGAACQECGEVFDEECGHSRLCWDCSNEAEAVNSDKWDRIGKNMELFKEAAILARKHGMNFTRHNGGIQYNLRTPTWIIQFYPGNQRIYSPRAKRGPYLALGPKIWTILDAVQAAINAKGKS